MAYMLSMFADMLSESELEHLQTHLCKFSPPSVQLQLCIKFKVMAHKDTTSQCCMSLLENIKGFGSHTLAADCNVKKISSSPQLRFLQLACTMVARAFIKQLIFTIEAHSASRK